MSFIVEPAALAESVYHPWAHSHWVWLHNGQSNQQNTTDLVNGYLENKIPVGAVDIDSTWATEFNNFEVNTDKFPDFTGLVNGLHDQNIRVILWATSMVNVENPDYEMCDKNSYLVRNGMGVTRPLQWWHGEGGLLDYTNPEAVSWWHSQMDKVLDVGVDGFKCDGTDPYIIEYQLLTGAQGVNDKNLTYRKYADQYYGDFFEYTRQKRGNTGLIMSRPVDCFDNVNVGCISYSPPQVMLSGWVGDDEMTFQGLRSCVRKVIYSAHSNYTNFGCDIAGYRGNYGDEDKELFVRWAQLGAFLPLMENGGGGEHRPWMYDQETVDIYRKFVLEHYRLVPYLLTTGNVAREQGVSSITPISPPDLEHPLHHPEPKTYSFLLGKDLLVHPVITNILKSDSNIKVSQVEMTFPGDASTQWLDFFKPWSADAIEEGDSQVRRAVAFFDYPVYVRRGALVPLAPTLSKEEDYAVGPVMFTWFAPVPSEAAVSAEAREYEGSGMIGTASLSAEGVFSATISSHATRSGGFEVYGITEPQDVVVEQAKATLPCVHTYLEAESRLTIRCSTLRGGVKITAKGVKNAF